MSFSNPIGRPAVTHDTFSFASLPSGSTLLVALLVLIVFYVGRSLWIARHEWPNCGTDTKIIYLLVAPLLTLAVDLLELTDRLFWGRRERQHRKPVHAPAGGSDG